MKESFLIYQSQFEAIKNEYTSEEKGILFDAICEYNFNGIITDLPLSIKVSFNFMKSQFDRDCVKYETICERNRNNGRKGGRPKKNEENPENPVGYLGNPEKPIKPDTETDTETETDTDTDTDTDNKIKPSPVWKKDFEVYKKELREAYKNLIADNEWIEKQEKFNPGVDIQKSIEKCCVNYWATEAGWKKKKGSKIKSIDWKSTFANAISLPSNRVYFKNRFIPEPEIKNEPYKPAKW